MQAETLDQNVSNSTPELAEPVTADTADGMETKESVENITENSSNVVGNDAAAAPNLIADENALQFDLNAEFLQQQQILYQQLTGAFQNDPNTITIRQQQEALSKFSINKSSKSEAVEGDKKESEEQKPKASVHKPSETPPQNVKPSEKPEPLPRTSQPPSSKNYGRFAALMEAFRSNDKNRQSEAVYELAELLLMGNEETLPDLPIREIVALLHALLKKENNLALVSFGLNIKVGAKFLRQIITTQTRI
uniref:Uncharacterized protein n=1 Tax=Panagrolaimus sp. PS1159 TaxID=55785 RepID=A0AC35F7P3_9BILA